MYVVKVYLKQQGSTRTEVHGPFETRGQAERFLIGLAQAGRTGAGTNIEAHEPGDSYGPP